MKNAERGGSAPEHRAAHCVGLSSMPLQDWPPASQRMRGKARQQQEANNQQAHLASSRAAVCVRVTRNLAIVLFAGHPTSSHGYGRADPLHHQDSPAAGDRSRTGSQHGGLHTVIATGSLAGKVSASAASSRASSARMATAVFWRSCAAECFNVMSWKSSARGARHRTSGDRARVPTL